jgi:hypothetical protein
MRKIVRKLYLVIPFKQPVYETMRRLLSVPDIIYRHFRFRGVIDVAVVETSFLLWHREYQIDNEVLWQGLFGRWEGASMTFLAVRAEHS